MIKRKIAIIGAGKLSFSLIPAMLKAGYNIQCVVSRKLNSAKSLSNKFSIPNHSNSIKKIPIEIDAFFLAVPDGEIKKVADNLSKVKRDFKNCICIHFSGVENIDSLRALAKKGCSTGSFHIMQTFPSKNLIEIKNSSSAIEAIDKTAIYFLNQLVKKLGLKSFRINSDAKELYHLAGVFSSNFLVGNLFNAFTLLKSEDKNPADIFRTTSYTTLKNIFGSTPAKSLSGPVDRGDLYAIKKHIEALDSKIRLARKKDQLKLLRMNYIIQSLGLLEVVKVKYRKPNPNHLKIKKYLNEKLNKSYI